MQICTICSLVNWEVTPLCCTKHPVLAPSNMATGKPALGPLRLTTLQVLRQSHGHCHVEMYALKWRRVAAHQASAQRLSPSKMGRSSRYVSRGKVQIMVLLYCFVVSVTGLPRRYRQLSCGSSFKFPNTCVLAELSDSGCSVRPDHAAAQSPSCISFNPVIVDGGSGPHGKKLGRLADV